jgi:RNA polymerase sigma factor for flagellar operon FliA
MYAVQSARPRAATDPSAALLAEHYPLARTVARRMHQRLPPGIDLDELVSVAVIGLMEACSRFDPSRGVAFRTFAKSRMHGAIIDALRSGDWVPRSVRRRLGMVDSASARLRDELGREPTTHEVAARLEIGVERVRAARDADTRPMVSLDAPADDDDGGALLDHVAADDERADAALERRQVQALAIAALADLPPRERTALELFYLQGVPLKQIGASLGVTESRACQLCRQGARRVRSALEPVVGGC